jgi:hypothetical protein
MSQMGQTRLGRADGKSGHVGYPPIATGFFGAATFRDVPEPDTFDIFFQPSCRVSNFAHVV